MRKKLRKTLRYDNPQLEALAKDVARALEAVLDQDIHEVSLTWDPPFLLRVPFFGGEDRLAPPKTVRCDRALDVAEETYVTPGGCAWKWAGNGQVKIFDVSGLVVGRKYELVFTVVG